MRATFHPEAIAEFQEAALYYDQQRTGLGGLFVDAVEAAVHAIQEAPERWALLDQGVRRCLVRVFPSALLYAVEPGFILILAVMHCHRRPSYWRSRSSN